MRARSLAREGQLSARRPNGVRGNPPTPPNSGIVATDDPIRRREDEEGGEVNNPQIDGMNPDRTGGERDYTKLYDQQEMLEKLPDDLKERIYAIERDIDRNLIVTLKDGQQIMIDTEGNPQLISPDNNLNFELTNTKGINPNFLKILGALGIAPISTNDSGFEPQNSPVISNGQNLERLKSSIIDDFKTDSRLITEKKLFELKLAGVDTKEIESALLKLRGGKDKPLVGGDFKEFQEYARIREGKTLFQNESIIFESSSDVLSRVNNTQNSSKETNASFFQRLGNEIRLASESVNLKTQKSLNEHIANVAKMLGSSLDGKIGYAQSEVIDGKEVVSAVNPVGSDGFRPVAGTDCIRFIGSVLNAAGYTGTGSFSNLNTNTYLSTDDISRMESEFDNKTAHKNGVEYFRQATNLLEPTSPRYTNESDVPKKGNFIVPDLEIGQIGITRKMEDGAMKSDHVYIITDKRYNNDTKCFEYLISESYAGHGVSSRWTTKKDNYLYRSEFYMLKPKDEKR